MRKTLIITIAYVVISIMPGSVFAGANNFELKCISTSTKTPVVTLEGSIPGDFAEFNLTLSQNDKSIEMGSFEDKISVITNFKHKIFTISVITSKYEELKLYAIPSTIKHEGGETRLFDAYFKGILVIAPKPGTERPSYKFDSYFHDIEMSCKVHHAI